MFKRTVKLLTLAVILFAGGNSFSQNQWDGNIMTLNGGHIYQVPYCEGISYSIANYPKDEIKIYNDDFECIKLIKLYSNATEVVIHNVFCLTKGVFTNQNKYEFVTHGYYKIGEENFDFAGIYNEDGECLYSFDDFSKNPNPFIVDNKLVINSHDNNGDVYAKIFTLAHSIHNQPNAISQIQQQNSSKLYPNPARNSVTLEYDIQGQMQEMQIVDINGRVIANYLLDPSQKQVKINTFNYKKGVYVYRYGNNSGKFVVK